MKTEATSNFTQNFIKQALDAEDLTEQVEQRKAEIAKMLKIEDLPYYMISNIILSQVCNEYVKTFKSNAIPASFIQFYISELSTYNQMFTNDLSLFMQRFFTNENEETEKVMRAFKKAFPTYAEKIVKKDKQLHIILNHSNSDIKVNFYTTIEDIEISISKENIENILNHYKNSDELYTLKELYENYLTNKEIESFAEKKKYTIAKLPTTKVEPKQKKNNIQEITKFDGKETALVAETGKVYRLRVPKFSLPIKYPSSKTKCLLHKKTEITGLYDAAEMIEFCNENKITKVRETQHFVDKRKRLLTPQKSKYSSFLDSF